MEDFLVIGHRGAMGHETENTVASIQKALDLGVHMIEIDVFKIASGELVVFHDDTVDALTNGTGEIEQYSLAQLKKLEVIGGHQIPLLQEVLDLIDGAVALNIELKGANTAVAVNHLVLSNCKNKSWTLDDFLISSFNWEALRLMRSVNEDIPIAILVEGDPVEALGIGNELKAIAINPYFKELSAQNVQQLKREGFKVYPWTVNTPKDILAMKNIGADGVFTNFPERAL